MAVKRLVLLGGLAVAAWFGGQQLLHWEGARFRKQLSGTLQPHKVRQFGQHRYPEPSLRLVAMEDYRLPLQRAKNVEPELADPVEAIADFSRRLDERGIALIVVPVPPRTLVNAPNLREGVLRWIPPSAYNEPYDRFIADLRHAGVDTLDLLGGMQRWAYWDSSYVHRTDAHWVNAFLVETAQDVAGRIQAKVSITPVLETTAAWKRVRRPNAYGGLEGPEGINQETIEVRSIFFDVSLGPIADAAESPVVVVGDSHVYWYDNFNAHFPLQLAHELGVPVDTVRVVGGGATRVREEFVRRAWADPAYLDGKKVVVWVWWMSGIYNEEWRIVPLERFPPLRVDRRVPFGLSGDRELMRRGRGEMQVAAWWVSPDDAEVDDDTLWLFHGKYGLLRYAGDAGRELIFELGTRPRPREFVIKLNGVELYNGTLPLPGRLRLPVPKQAPRDLNVLSFWAKDSPGLPSKGLTIGVKSVVRTSRHRVFAQDFDRLREDAKGLSLRGGVPGVAVVRSGAEVHFDLGARAEQAGLRVRLQSPPQWAHQDVQLTLDGEVVLSNLRVDASGWVEPAVSLGSLAPGEHVLGFMLSKKKMQVWLDMVEVDVP